jgi:hypothetical protein
MPPPGREVQAERLGTLPASRARCKPLLYGERRDEGLESIFGMTPGESDQPATRPAYLSASRRCRTKPTRLPGTTQRSPQRRPRPWLADTLGRPRELKFPGGGVRCGRAKSESASADVRRITDSEFCWRGLSGDKSGGYTLINQTPPTVYLERAPSSVLHEPVRSETQPSG